MSETAPRADVQTRLADILGEVLDRDAEEIAPDQSLVVDLAVDSLAMIEIVIGVEQAFGVVIADADVRSIGTVAELTAYVEQRLV